MDNELIQAIRSVMQEELQPIIKRLDTLEKGQERLEKGQTDLDKGLERLEKQQANFEKQQANFEKRQTGFEGVLAALDKRQASKADVAVIDTKLDLLNARLFKQEADLQLIKKAQ